jgi:hypothetical protein
MLTTSYSPLLHTLYDEPSPVGHIGRGAHYSVLGAMQWQHPLEGESLVYPLIQRVGVLWDEDHDTRVIDMLEAGYLHSLLYPVLFIGERKASLTVVVRDEFDLSDDFAALWERTVERVGSTINDHWNVEVVHVRDATVKAQVINDKADVVNTYLRNILNVWQLGMHRHPCQHFGDACGPGKTLVEFSKPPATTAATS